MRSRVRATIGRALLGPHTPRTIPVPTKRSLPAHHSLTTQPHCQNRRQTRRIAPSKQPRTGRSIRSIRSIPASSACPSSPLT
jgi:hypothetical protein